MIFKLSSVSLALVLVKVALGNTLNLTTIALSDHGHSVLECWQLSAPVTISASPGTVGATTVQLGGLSNATYTVLPPHANGGQHNAPFVQYVAFSSGLANITLPHSDDFAVVHGGAHGLILAVDISGDGHITTYTGDKPTFSLQIPTEGNEVPPHSVLHPGACCYAETHGFGV